MDPQQKQALQNIRKLLYIDSDPAAIARAAARQCLPLIASSFGLLCLRNHRDDPEGLSVYRYELASDGQERGVSEARLPVLVNAGDAEKLEALDSERLFRSKQLPDALQNATAHEGSFLCCHFHNNDKYWATLLLRLPAWASQDDVDILQQRLVPVSQVSLKIRHILENRALLSTDYATAMEALEKDDSGSSAEPIASAVKQQTPVPTQEQPSKAIEEPAETSKNTFIEHAEQERYRALSRLMKDGMLEANSNWQATYCNDELLEITGKSEHGILGSGWLNLFHHNEASSILANLRSELVSGCEYEDVLRLESSNKAECWVQLDAIPLHDDQGEFNGFLLAFRDISAQRQAEQRLQHLVDRDDLTGLTSRRSAESRLRDLLSDSERKLSVALFFIDLDNFKRINDSLGHDVGDEVLKVAAKRLINCMRDDDIVSRFGGDEFVIIMDNVDSLIASQRADRILLELKKPFTIFNQEMFLSGSIGISLSSSRGAKSVTTLMKQADVALYRAKDAGRNNYQFYTEAISRSLNERLLLGNSLHRALEKKEFRVVYQLIANVNTHEVQGIEALLRWHHPKLGTISPDIFIPLLEETGLINSVSDWLIRNAISQTAAWIDAKKLPDSAKLSINVSPQQLREPEFPNRLKELLDQFGLAGHNLVVELTETVLFKDASSVKHQLLRIREHGIRIAVDDFGTGYSSLTYLKRFPIDIIKLDRSFVQDLKIDPEDETIAFAVIALGQSLGLQVVAEGVEDEETLQRLRSKGCDSYQGHLLNQAVEAIGVEFEHPLIPVDKPAETDRNTESS